MRAGDLEIITKPVADNPRIRARHPRHELLLIWNESPVAPSSRKYSFSVRHRRRPREFSRPRPCRSWGQAAHAVRTECRVPRPRWSSAVASRRRPDRVHRKRTSPPPPPTSPAPPWGRCFSLWGYFLSKTVEGKQLRLILTSPRCSQSAAFETQDFYFRNFKKINAFLLLLSLLV